MLFCRGLGINLFSNHLDNLLTDNLVIQVESFQACNKLTRVGDLVFRYLLGILLTIMKEEVLKFLDLFQKSDGINFSGTKERWMSKLGLLALSS